MLWSLYTQTKVEIEEIRPITSAWSSERTNCSYVVVLVQHREEEGGGSTQAAGALSHGNPSQFDSNVIRTIATSHVRLFIYIISQRFQYQILCYIRESSYCPLAILQYHHRRGHFVSDKMTSFQRKKNAVYREILKSCFFFIEVKNFLLKKN